MPVILGSHWIKYVNHFKNVHMRVFSHGPELLLTQKLVVTGDRNSNETMKTLPWFVDGVYIQQGY